MDERVQDALGRDRTIDITTRGRKTGQLHHTELWFHHIDGHVYITGSPGRRDWYANLLAHPEFTFHLKQSTKPTYPLEPRRSWIAPDAVRSSLASIRRLAALEIWMRGLRVVRWSRWNSSSSELAYDNGWGRGSNGHRGHHNGADRANFVFRGDHAGWSHA